MSDKQEVALLPCPFCGAGETRVDEKAMWTGHSSQVISATVMHWCPKSPLSSLLQLTAKTRDEAIALWNRRTDTRGQAVAQVPSDFAELDKLYLTLNAANKQATWCGSFERESGGQRQAVAAGKMLWDETLKVLERRRVAALSAAAPKQEEGK